MKQLDFSKDLGVPLSVVTQKLAFLGISGSGKTYGSGKLVEETLDAGGQVVIIDTIGNWWGLRLAADGKKPGISIPILGGMKGDVPLESIHGRLAAETVAESRASMILDVSDFTKGELRRFVTDFAESLLRLKKKHPSPVLVVWEECQDVVPQKVMGENAVVVGAVEKLIKKGRNYGVGTVLISQRAAAVNKDVLNQIETLFVFRLNAPQDRKAIQDWIVHQDVDVGALVDELPTLPTGTCFCWSPQWLKFLGKVRVAKKRTYDASATPEFGEEFKAGELAPIDLEKFKKTMGQAIEKAKENVPEFLKRRIAELERELKTRPVEHPRVEVKKVQVPILKEPQANQLKKVAERLLKDVPSLTQLLTAVLEEVKKFDTPVFYKKTPSFEPSMVTSKMPARDGKAALPKLNGAPARAVRAIVPKDDDGGLGRCEREILRALAARHPSALSRTQIATLSGYSQNSSGFANAMSKLNTGGYIQKGYEGVSLTEKGLSLVGDVPAPTSPDELLNLWATKLPGKEAAMLQVLQSAGERGLTRNELAAQVELSTTSSGFANYLSHLNSNGLIRKEGGVIKASPLFL